MAPKHPPAPKPLRAPRHRQARATLSSAWPTTSPVAATSRSTTLPPPALEQAQADLGITFQESTPTGEGDRAERLQGLVDSGAVLVQRQRLPVQGLHHDRRCRQPGRQLHARRRRRRCPQRGLAHVRRGAGLVPRRRRRSAQEPDRHDRLHRWRPERADRKFEAGYIAGAKAVNPDIEVLVKYITQPPDFSGFNDPPRARRSQPRSTRPAPTSSTTLPAARARRLPGRRRSRRARRGVGHRRRLRPVNLVEPNCSRTSSPRCSSASTSPRTRPSRPTATATFAAGAQVFDLSVDGVGYSTTGGFVADINAELEEFKAQIISGNIVVPTDP